MSAGERNCPFLMLTTRPVRAAATRRSVCRERNAGICSTSAISATGAACDGSWMSVRIGTPAAARTRPRMRSPSTRPGPRNDRPDVRFALSYDALNTYGTPGAARDVANRERRVDRVRLALDDTGSGDEQERWPPPIVRPPNWIGCTPTYPTTEAVACGVRGELALMAGVDEPGEQRMRTQRLRLELRVELHGHVPRMGRQLDDLDELAVERSADDLQPLVGERLFEQAVELVPMAMPFADDVGAVELAARVTPGSARRRTIPAASCRRGRRRRAGRAACR